MLHIITLGSNENEMRTLKESALGNDVNIKFIVCEKWNGYVDKIIRMQEAISELPEDDIVCFIDAYDVLLFCDETEILSKFKEYHCDIVLSGELNCYPGENIHRYNDIYNALNLQNMTNFRYVNSGGYIGYKHAIQKLYNWKPLDEIHEISKLGGDQNYFTEYYLNHALNTPIKIDMYEKIFQSMYKIHYEGIEFRNGRLYNNVLEQEPCFVHFNGYGGYHYQIYSGDYRRDIRDLFLEKIEQSRNHEHVNLDGFRPPYFYQYPNINQL